MELIGSGRAADIFDIGNGRVLRRSRVGENYENEAKVMEWVRAHGVAVPEVFDVDGDGLVMQRLHGQTLLTTLRAKPWTAWQIGAALGALHRRLDDVPVPQWLIDMKEPIESVTPGSGSRSGSAVGVVHLDLHPDNVMLHDGVPFLIDWTNGRAAPRALDVATSWLILGKLGRSTKRGERLIEGGVRRTMIKAMLRANDRRAARAQLPATIRWRLNDRKNLPAEQAALHHWLDKLTS